MEILTQRDRLPFDTEIKTKRTDARQNVLHAAVMEQLQPKVMGVAAQVADVVAHTKPVVLPMTWSKYPERLWDPEYNLVAPCVVVPVTRMYWTYTNWVYGVDHEMAQIVADTVTIHAVSEPSWETFRRWGDTIVERFYTAMRAARMAWNIKWRDYSRTRSRYESENLNFSYVSKEPITTIVTPITPIEEYGRIYELRETRVVLGFTLALPNTPEGASMPSCHVVEEIVEVTEKKKVKRISCE